MFRPCGGEGSFVCGRGAGVEREDEVKVEVLERVELGWTGPRDWREAAKSGSRASSEIAKEDLSFHNGKLHHRIIRLTFVLGLAGLGSRMDGRSYDRGFRRD